MPGRASPLTVISALAGKFPSGNVSLRISTKRSPLRTSVMNTVMVTMFLSEPPARCSVLSRNLKIVRACASKLPAMLAPFSSVSVVWPAR
jgi:hypothetical protein